MMLLIFAIRSVMSILLFRTVSYQISLVEVVHVQMKGGAWDLGRDLGMIRTLWKYVVIILMAHVFFYTHTLSNAFITNLQLVHGGEPSKLTKIRSSSSNRELDIKSNTSKLAHKLVKYLCFLLLYIVLKSHYLLFHWPEKMLLMFIS